MIFLLLQLLHAGDPAMLPSNEGGIVEVSPVQNKKSQNLSDLMDILEESGSVDANEISNLKKSLKAKERHRNQQSRKQLRLNDKTQQLSDSTKDPQANQ